MTLKIIFRILVNLFVFIYDNPYYLYYYFPFDKTVKVDDAVDDIVRQFKGVSDGLARKVVSSPTASYTPLSGKNLSSNDDEINKLALRQNTSEPLSSFSDKDDGDKDGGSSPQANEWHSDNEFNSKELPHQAIKHDEDFKGLRSDIRRGSGLQHEPVNASGCPEANFAIVSGQQENPIEVPPEVFIIFNIPGPSKMNYLPIGF